jgi:DNA polymerase III subunit beta
MKVDMLKTQLKEGLDITERSTTRSPSLPILNNILFSANGGEIKLAATDLQMGITYRILGAVREPGQAVFPARLLSSLVGTLPEGQITLELKNQELLVKAGQHQSTIKTLDVEEFPIIPSIKGGEPSSEVQTSILCKGLSQVVGMAGQSQTKPEISGVLFVFEKKGVRVAATDSFRLAERKFLLEKEQSEEQSFILPQKTVKELVATLGEKEGKTKVYFSPTQIIFDYTPTEETREGKIQIVSRVIDGEYPHYEEVIPTTHKTKAVLPRGDFLDHVRAASIFAGKTNEVRLLVEPGKKGITFSSKDAGVGENQSFLEGEVEGENVEVAFNWRFLGEGLAQMKGDRVEFYINGEDGPALLRSPDQEEYLYVIMPVKA